MLPILVLAQRQRTTKWESGTLEKNQKVGVWEYYSYAANGEQIVTQKYDHTAGKLVYCRPDDKEYLAETEPGKWTNTPLTQAPWFIGGHEALAAYIAKLKYPAQAESREVQGRVVVGFVIDTLGQVSDHKIMRGIGSGCDEEALRVCRTVPGNWVPGRIGSRAVPVRYELPFTFRLH
ncbi:energy transducer TonB [Hymenobacter weizhouensis]|uniref:energy transducer TonB n=1 Tax=Hymenobacter sp. YIM 151500-1 TaxID=2987689 RepID=UPI002227BF85|nr:energy transducer TonB [Hymenobacter sp. YIM 151500-1]UYZ63132.1 energy transducer TonB [Hymenobacter sp. YIM 151500-1]